MLSGGKKTLDAIAVTPDSVAVAGWLFILIRPFGVVILLVVIPRRHIENMGGGTGWLVV